MDPEFDQLPTIDALGLRHAWDVFGHADDLGTVNLMTPPRIAAAAQSVRAGRVVNLSLPLTEPAPPMYGREPIEHTIFALNRNNLDERIDSFYPQGSSQWDGLRHVRCREYGYYGGYTEDVGPGAGRLGIEHWVRHGLVGRGVLLDVQAYLRSRGEELDQFRGRPIEAEELEAAARWQGVRIEPGDVLCIRFGWIEAYRKLAGDGHGALPAETAFPGLSAAESTARLLWNWRVSAVACDNPAVEVSPGDPAVGSLHRRLIPMLGMALGELFDFDELRDACQKEGRHTFLFVAVPLHLPGAVGSPANAVAIL